MSKHVLITQYVPTVSAPKIHGIYKLLEGIELQEVLDKWESEGCDNNRYANTLISVDGVAVRLMRREYKLLTDKEFEDYKEITHTKVDDHWEVIPEWKIIFGD